MFFINKNKGGKHWNVAFGIAELLDAIVRIITLGVVATNFPSLVCKLQVKK